MPGFLHGMELSNNGLDPVNDINVAAGIANATQADPVLMRLAASITKRMDAAWAVGSGNGCLDAGAIGDGVYHIFAIHRPDTGVTDILASLSPSAPLLPANYTMSRRIGSIIRVAGANLKFTQNGDEFLLDEPTLDFSGSTTSATTARALTVPTGIKVEAKIRLRANNSSGWYMIVTSTDVKDQAPGNTVAPLADLGAAGGTADRAQLCVRTNINGEIKTTANTALDSLQISTLGWIDRRGK